MSIFKTRYRVVQRKNTPHGQFRIEVSKPSDFWVWKEYESYATCQTLDVYVCSMGICFSWYHVVYAHGRS